MANNVAVKTIDDFSDQWRSFRDSPGYYGSAHLLADIFGSLLPIEEISGLRVADIGSGTGRIVNMLLDAGAQHVYAVEPSAGIEIVRENTADRRDRVTCIKDVGEHLSADLNVDLIVSMGVLDHIPDPAPVVRAAYAALRPGGLLLIWIYGKEGNETYLSFALPLRRLTTRLPHALLTALTYILSVPLDGYIWLCQFFKLPMYAYMRGHLGKLPRKARRLTIYDQLNPAYAKYYTRQEAHDLVASAGFKDVQLYHRHGYSWTVLGRKPQN